MKVLIPTKDEAGLLSRAHDHFGSAPFFTLVDTDTGSVEVIRNSGATEGHGHGHGPGACRALRRADLPPFDAVVCRGMGRRALATLLDEGLVVLVIRKSLVTDIIEAVKAGQTARLSSVDACEGRPHEIEGSHEEERGAGYGHGRRRAQGRGTLSGRHRQV